MVNLTAALGTGAPVPPLVYQLAQGLCMVHSLTSCRPWLTYPHFGEGCADTHLALNTPWLSFPSALLYLYRPVCYTF